MLRIFVIMFWFSGYYTGRNYETSSYPAKPDPELVYIATLNYCNKNPLKDTVDIADFLYSSLIWASYYLNSRL